MVNHHRRNKGLSRRSLLQLAGAGALAVGIGVPVATQSLAVPKPASASKTPDSADGILQQLLQGNRRYIAQKASHPHQANARMQEVAKGQHPVAIVLSCADSRVPPEIVFDQGLGDLFVVRVAGNIVDEGILASIEYAAEELHVPLLVVLGHERCGAVAATLKGGELPGHISKLAEAIKPAVDSIQGKPGDALDNAVRANIQRVVQQLKASTPILAELCDQKKLKVVGARYDLDQGAVEVIA